jgi:4-hydroxy-3-polyprenylbenzoate decarboxylase
VHPLLFAVGSERYTPYLDTQCPAELLTQANRILGSGQLSLAKFLFIAADQHQQLSAHDPEAFLQYILQRIDLTRDVHFYTNTTIDTLDYSGTGINSGSKVVFACYGAVKRTLLNQVPNAFVQHTLLNKSQVVMPGVIAIQAPTFINQEQAEKEITQWAAQIEDAFSSDVLQQMPLIIWCDDSAFMAATINNFLWATFTRCNPSHDIYGVGSFTQHKHWGCTGPLIIDARVKPHHAPALIPDAAIEAKVDVWMKKLGLS